MRRTLALSIVLGLAAVVGPAAAQESPPAGPAGSGRPAPPAVTLAEAVRRATVRNPTAEVAVQEVARAEALARQARAGWFPTLTGNGAYTRLDSDRVSSGKVIAAQDQLSANVQLTVPIIAAQKWVAHARTKENIEIQRAANVDARRTVALAAARAYLTVIASRRILQSAEHALDTTRSHEEYAKTRFQGGVGNRLDSVRAAQERAAADARVKSQLIALARAQEALGVAVGEETALDAVEDPSLGTLPQLDAAMADTNARRSDIEVQRQKVESTRKAVRDSWVDYMPTLSFVAQPFYQTPATLTTPETGWQAQLVLQLPLYDGGYRYGAADEREALAAQARSRLDGALRQARSEVRIAFDAVLRADEALASAREAARLAQESLELAQIAYRGGATSNIEVVDAERRANDAETAAAIAEDDSRQARLDLLAASGRFP
jgi:outer membrane protein TolC